MFDYHPRIRLIISGFTIILLVCFVGEPFFFTKKIELERYQTGEQSGVFEMQGGHFSTVSDYSGSQQTIDAVSVIISPL